MRNSKSISHFLFSVCSFILWFTVPSAFSVPLIAQQGTGGDVYARTNTVGFLVAYSPDSSHILMGTADNRRLLNLGVSYNRKIWVGSAVNWQYSGELLPVALESDPVVQDVNNQTAPKPATYVSTQRQSRPCKAFSFPYADTYPGVTYVGTEVFTCIRTWTIGEAFSPVGFQWNFLPAHKLQPFFVGHGGYMYSSIPIPDDRAGAFNFTFDLGVGLELYRSRSRSIRAEYRYHHISNHWTAADNPGIDNGLFQVTYAFGR